MDTFTYDGSQPAPKDVVRVIVAANVTTIKRNAFKDCKALEYIELPDSLTTIERDAFYDCTSLASVKLPSSLTTLGGGAFEGCTSLTSIDLPSSLTTLGESAFYGCTSLTSIDLPSSLTTLGNRAFEDCTSLASIDLPSSLTTLGDRAFLDCTSLASIDLPSSLTTLGYWAFSGCTSLTSMKLPSSLTTLGDFAFAGCTSLTSIDLPSSLTTLGGRAFAGCTSLTLIDLPSSLTTLGDGAFFGCTNLLPVQIPPNATTEGDDIFKGCTKIQKARRFEGSFNASTGGVHDSPAADPDRLGYTPYAMSLVEVTQQMESLDTSICVALYGPWGSGKTFLKKRIGEIQVEKRGEAFKERIQTKKKWNSILESLRRQKKWNSILESLRRTCLESVCKLAVFICQYLTCNFSKSPHIELVATVLATMPILLPIWICLFPFAHCVVLCRGSKPCDCSYNKSPSIDLEEGEQPHAETSEEITFSQVWNILDGTTSLHSTLSFRNRNCMEMMRYYLLSFLIKPAIHMMIAHPTKSMQWVASVLCKKKYKTTDNKALTKYIEVNFNAWVYNGSDHLWASLLEEMWRSIEKEFGAYRVRLHRASISISGELDSDDVTMKRNKRDAAIVGLKMKAILYLILFLVGNCFAFVYGESIMLSLQGVLVYAVSALSSIPLLGYIVSFGRKVLPELLKSQGAKIVKEVKGFEKHQRVNFKEETGFMGKVKKEVEYLFDFLRTELVDDQELELQMPVRLSVFVDDLDRCQPSAIMSVLEAVILLLADAPITCWLAIDSRVIVSSIESYYGEHFMKEGLDGYKFLDKIVQLPFCIPEPTHDSKSSFIRKIALKSELDPVRIYQRVKLLYNLGKLNNYSSCFSAGTKRRYFTNELAPPPTTIIYKDVLVPLFDYLLANTKDGGVFAAIRKGANVGPGMNTPDKVLKLVKIQLEEYSPWNQQDFLLGQQLEEEFLHFLSGGIEKIRLFRHEAFLGDQVESFGTAGSTLISSKNGNVGPNTRFGEDHEAKDKMKSVEEGSSRVEHHDSQLSSEGDDDVKKEEVIVLQESENFSEVGASTGDNYGNYYQPMLDMFESEQCFHRYSKYCTGEPRKIKRIINSYMVSRSVAKQAVFRAAGTGSDDALGNILREKLLKLIILCEQWPYRMSWLFVLIENLQQEKNITRTVNCQHDKQNVPVGRFLTSILDEYYKKFKENNGTSVENSYDELPLLELYHLVVEGLIHSPNDARLQLQRDADPQVFEMLLSDSGGGDDNNDDAAGILRIKDVASCCSGKEISSDDGSLRPFIFNLQRHMIEKVQLYVDECVVHPPASQPQLQCNHSAFFEKKSAFFSRSNDRINNHINDEADNHWFRSLLTAYTSQYKSKET